MTFRVVYDADTDCVVTSVSGEIDKDVVLAFFSEKSWVLQT